MRRELLDHIRVSSCCPGHDHFPSDTYSSRRSKRARARDKKMEHQVARSKRRAGVRREVSALVFA